MEESLETHRPKFVIPITGPLMKYRLEIIKEVSKSVIKHMIIFTDKYSYNLYKDYHNIFDFVIMDDYRNKDKFSIENELLLNCDTEEEYLKKFNEFYGDKTGVYYPWELHRFVFEYLMENNITNFVITQTDFIFYDDSDMMIEFFNTIPKGSLYTPLMGEEGDKRDWLWNELQKKFKQIKFEYDGILKAADGFLRGFNFYNVEDMKLFYNIWSEAIKIPITNKYAHITKMAYTDFIVPWLMQVFAKQKNYNFNDMHDFTFMKKYGKNIGRHYTRVEDTIYAGPRPGWEKYGFDYSDTSSIKNFIKNNKVALKNYYGPFDVEITDEYVLTRMR